MGIGDRIGRGRGGGPGRRWPRVRLRRPTGIRNGGLLLVLVALAAVLALVDGPPQPGAGRRLPGIFQYLPPPVGIAQTPPVVAQPLRQPRPQPRPPTTASGRRPRTAGTRAGPIPVLSPPGPGPLGRRTGRGRARAPGRSGIRVGRGRSPRRL
jgi:hypothetical protein